MEELWQLCSDGDLDGVRAALANGAGVNSRGGRGNYTCLMWAAYGQCEDVVNLLLQQPGIQVNARSQANRTALHFACHYGSGRMVKRLLAHPGIDLNVRGVNGQTPLMAAVAQDKEEVVKEMVAVQGVDITTRDAEGKSLEEVGRENAAILRLLQIAGEREEARKRNILREEKEKETLVKDISRLWINASESGDFLIVCQNQEFPCHRAILSARSPTFASGIASRMSEAGGRWIMRDAEGDEAEPLAVKDMLEYIYTSRIPEDGIKERPGDLLDLAMQYQLPGLGEACKEAIIEGLTPQNAVVSLIQLDKYIGGKNEEVWKNRVLEFIKKNAKAVVKGEHWKTFVKNYEDLVTDIVTCLAN